MSASDKVTVVIIFLFLKRNFIFKHNYAGKFDVPCDVFS